MVFQPFSPEIEQIFDITGTTVLYIFRSRLPHPQAGMMKFSLRSYKDETLDHLDHVVLVTCILLGAFSKAELEKLAKVQSAHVDVYWKKAWGGMTAKEIEEEKKAMKKQRQENHRKSVNSFYEKDPAACLKHAQKTDKEKTLADLTYDDKKSYMMSCRYETMADNFYEKDPAACLKHAQKKDPKKTLEDLTLDDKKSYMMSVRKEKIDSEKAANDFYEKDPTACLTHAQKKDPKKTLEDLTLDDKKSYMMSVRFDNATANGKGAGAWHAASEEERKEKGWKDNQTRSNNRKGEINKKPSGNFVSVLLFKVVFDCPCVSHTLIIIFSKEVKVDGLQIGTYKKKKIAELAARTAVEVFNSAPMSEDSASILERARDAAFKATDCPSAKPREHKSGEDFLVHVDEEKKWCRGSGTPRNRTWIRSNIRGSKATLKKICDNLEQDVIQSSTDRVTKTGDKKVKIEYFGVSSMLCFLSCHNNYLTLVTTFSSEQSKGSQEVHQSKQEEGFRRQDKYQE